MKNVRKYRKGLYQARCCVNGHKIVVYGKTAVQAYDTLQLKKQEFLLSPISEISEDMLFSDWFWYWIKNYKENIIRNSSVRALKCCYKNHISEKFRNLRLKEIKVLDIERELNKIEKSRTRKYTQTVISGSLRKAYKLELIKKPIYDFVETKSHVTNKGSALSIVEQKDLLNAVPEFSLQTLFLFYIFSGARRSEALTVKTSDIDFKNKRLLLRGSKTKKSFRYIPLFPQLESLLMLIIKNNTDFLFPFSADYVTHKFKEYCPQHSLKDLRHTFATRCLENGVPMKVVQEWLGHSTYNMTANTYTHVTASLSEKYAEKVNFGDCSQLSSQK